MKKGIREVLAAYFRIFRVYPFLVGVWVIAFLSTVGLAVIIPTLPLYLRNSAGLSASVIGLLFSIYAVTETLAKTPFGALSDCIGRRRVILLGLFFTAFVPLGFIYAKKVVFLAFLQVLNGLGVAAFWPVISALIADYVSEEERTSALSVVNMAYLTALGLGPAVGSYVNHFLKADTAAFKLAFVLLLISCLGVLLFFPCGHGREVRHAQSHDPVRNSSSGVLKQKQVGKYTVMLFISLLQQFGVGMLASTFVLYVNRQLGFSQGQIGTALLVPALMVALFALPLSSLADRVGKPLAVQSAYLLSAGVLALIPFLDQAWQLVGAVAFLALAYVVGAPAWLALASVFAPSGRKGAVLAGIGTMQSLGYILGSPVGGLLYDRLQPQAPFFAGSAFLFLCFALVLLFFTERRSRVPRPSW